MSTSVSMTPIPPAAGKRGDRGVSPCIQTTRKERPPAYENNILTQMGRPIEAFVHVPAPGIIAGMPGTSTGSEPPAIAIDASTKNAKLQLVVVSIPEHGSVDGTNTRGSATASASNSPQPQPYLPAPAPALRINARNAYGAYEGERLYECLLSEDEARVLNFRPAPR